MDDAKVRDIIRDLRYELGYDRPPPPEVQYPEWLTDFFRGLGNGISAILNWIAAGGWRMLVPVLVVIAGIIVYLLLRKIPTWQTVSESGEAETADGNGAAAQPADKWLAKAEEAAARGDYTAGILHLYRAGLFVCLKQIKPEGELANREIRRKIPGDWATSFESLYLAAERILFDNADGTADDFGRLAAVYREGFR
jgi:hypothetical protein